MSRVQPLKRFLRVRPAAPGDGQIVPGALVLHEETNTATVVSPGRVGRGLEVPVDGAFGESRTQEEVWEVLKPVVQQLGHGKNATIALYGVTGSGKTYTMEGTTSDPGLSIRAVEAVLELPNLDKLTMSYVEVHNAEIQDLLHHQQQKLAIRTMAVVNRNRANEREKFVIPDITVETIGTVEDFTHKFSEAAARRKTGSTRLNKTSSRSHGVLMLSLSLTDMVTGQPLHAQLKLVDMAGSEDNRKTGNSTKTQMRESSAINTSLLNLKEVVRAIHEGRKPPFRNSPLTRILQDCLGGDSLGYLMCCLAPGSNFAMDTYNTVSFIGDAGSVRNIVSVNHVIPPSKPAAVLSPAVAKVKRTVGLGQPARAVQTTATGLPLRRQPTIALRSIDTNIGASRPIPSKPSTQRLGVNGASLPRLSAQHKAQPDPQMMKLASDNSKLRSDIAGLVSEKARQDATIDRLQAEVTRLTGLIPKHPALNVEELKACAYVSLEAGREQARANDWAGALVSLKRTQSIAPTRSLQERIDKIEHELAVASGRQSVRVTLPGANSTFTSTSGSIRSDSQPVMTAIRA